MLEEAYYFGLTPERAFQLTFYELASFVEARRKRQLDDWRMMANVGYTAGIVGSMSFSKTRPRFEELFNFPKEETKIDNVDKHKAEMMAWAFNVNRQNRKVR